MINKPTFLLMVSGLSLATAQFSNPIPSCAQKAVSDGIAASGCSSRDFECICRSGAFQTTLHNEVATNCSATDQATTNGFFQRVCSGPPAFFSGSGGPFFPPFWATAPATASGSSNTTIAAGSPTTTLTSVMLATAASTSRTTSSQSTPSATGSTVLGAASLVGSASTTAPPDSTSTATSTQQQSVTDTVGFKAGIGIAAAVVGLVLAYVLFRLHSRYYTRKSALEAGPKEPEMATEQIPQATHLAELEHTNPGGVSHEIDGQRVHELEAGKYPELEG